MNKKIIVFFILVILSIYFLINYYIFIRGWQALPNIVPVKIIYISAFLLVFISYILSRFLERTKWVKVSEPFTWLGSIWLAAMFYFFLFVVLIDLIRLLDFMFGFLPESIYYPRNNFNLMILIFISSIVFLLIIAGFINARNPVIKRLNIQVPKKANGINELKIVAVSDIHMGMLVKRRMIFRLVKTIIRLKPDIVLIAGDMLDEVIEPVIKYNLGEPFKRIKAKYGIYAITGNHEFIGGVEKSIRYIESLGIKVLKDEVIKIAEAFYLAGRYDHDIIRFTNNKRKELKELLINIDPLYPLILLDHQPFHLEKAVECGVDLQISGHTHHGQIWPFNLITKAIFEISRGYKKKGETHFYVSSGFGSWGPPLRIGNKPEIVFIKLLFANSKEILIVKKP
jgi:predicted MPP superfamily phosphohydrolase